MIDDGTTSSHDWDVIHSYDRSTERPSRVVVRAVAGTTNRPVCSMDPLYDAIDPDALDDFIDSGTSTGDARLSFGYEDCRVQIDEGSVSVSQMGEVVSE